MGRRSCRGTRHRTLEQPAGKPHLIFGILVRTRSLPETPFGFPCEVQHPVLDFCDGYVVQTAVRRPHELDLHMGRSRTSDIQPPCGRRSELHKVGGFGVYLNIPLAIEVLIRGQKSVWRQSHHSEKRQQHEDRSSYTHFCHPHLLVHHGGGSSHKSLYCC